MARYEAVPLTVNEQDDLTARRVGTASLNASPKTHIHTYTKIANNDTGSLEPPRRRLPDFCISPVILIALAIFFATGSTTTGLLYHFSQARDGLKAEEDKHRYAWIYGPAAVLVLLQVIWRVIDLKTKQTMPWHELARGPSSAKKTLLLEYISPMIWTNIWRSVNNEHWAVAMTILGRLLLLLMTVFATGLFSLETVLVTDIDVPLKSNQLDTSSFSVTNVSTGPAFLNLAILTQNLSYPLGTTRDTVVPVFEPINKMPETANYEAVVKGVGVSLDCENLDLENATEVACPWWSIQAPCYIVNITTPTCDMINVSIAMGADHGYSNVLNATQTYQATIENYVCNSGLAYDRPHRTLEDAKMYQNETLFNKSTDRTLDDRILLSMVDLRFTPTAADRAPKYMWVHNITALLCKPSYSINEYRTVYYANETGSDVELIRKTDDELDNFYTGDISKLLLKIFNDYENMYIGMGGSDYVLATPVPPVFQMMQLLHGAEKTNFTLKGFMEPDLLKSSAEAILLGTITQHLHQRIMTESPDTGNNTLQGTLRRSQERLQVRALSMGFLCMGFASMSILSVALFLVLPRKLDAKGNVGSISTIANVMRSNLELVSLFASLDQGSLKDSLDLWRFLSHREVEGGPLMVDCVINSHMKASETTRRKNPTIVQWWRPASSRSWFTATSVAITLLTIGLLEFIQHLSDRHNGFMDLGSKKIDSAVLSLYLPTAIALGITTMFSSIELTVATFSPFSTLGKGKAAASRTLSLDYVTNSGPHVFIAALRNGHFALSIILATTFVSSFLAIVIPGLYSQVTIPSHTNMTLLQLDKFDPSAANIAEDDKRAGALLTLLTYYDIEYPSWVYEDLAFPQLRFEDTNQLGDFNMVSATLSLRTSAIRAKLSCESISDQIMWEATRLPYDDSIDVTASSRFPWSLCSNPPLNSSFNASPWKQRFSVTDFGVPFHLGNASMIYWHIFQLDFDTINMQNWGCPSLEFTLGTISVTPTSKNATNYTVDADMSVLVCSQQLQSVETNLTLSYPGLTISRDFPPQPIESTAKWLQNSTDKNGFYFGLDNLLLYGLGGPNGTRTASGSWSDIDLVDNWMRALVHSAEKRNNVSLGQMIGKNNEATLVEMAEKIYGRYMAEALSNNMRVDVEVDIPDLTTTDSPWKAIITPLPALNSTLTTKKLDHISTGNSSTTSKMRLNNISTVYNSTHHNSIVFSLPTTSGTLPNNTFGFFLSQTRSGIGQAASSTLVSSRDSKNPEQATSTTYFSSQTGSSTVLYTSSISDLFFPKRTGIQRRAAGATPTLTATLTRTGRSGEIRLKQNRSPKIALQVILAVMSVGAILTRLLLRTKDTLPHEPYSIAGRATLIANGDVLRTLREGSGKIRNQGRIYRLQWWEDGQGHLRYGICEDRSRS
ncbi:hypothetical protein K504DRAFT_495288 [Pleomassaria siparia CBS 279.74]|uniref:Uncharacterized protein n=1 Tax=Pleomassaria siparia CBS 279.74 TaxID=1314801 RepID=A0A6G1JT59_9PLEO|nr:hypothetical protein K504DRAFT_495288 [Pleomassaria siparia CBS 279.74]